MLESVLAIPFWLEFAATITGGISGAMHGVRANYDVFGVVCLAVIEGLAGGILRDVLLQDYGIYAFQRPSLIVGCAIAGIVVFFFGKLVAYLDPVIDLLDNLSVAFWAVIGAGKGLEAGLGIIPAIILGTITAIGGGVLRDICMNREPEVFHASTLYGMAAFLGSLAYTLMAQVDFLEPYAAITCVILVLVLRYASLLFGWHTVPPRDYSDKVLSVLHKPVEWVNRFLRFVGLKREERAESTADIKKKIKGYERLRSIWRAPGKTSPLPPVSELEGGLEEKLEEKLEDAEEGAGGGSASAEGKGATEGSGAAAGAHGTGTAGAHAAADARLADSGSGAGSHAAGAAAGECAAADARKKASHAAGADLAADAAGLRVADAVAEDAQASVPSHVGGAHAASAAKEGSHASSDTALAVRAPAYMVMLAEASAAAQVQAPGAAGEGEVAGEGRAAGGSCASGGSHAAGGDGAAGEDRALQEDSASAGSTASLRPLGASQESRGPQGPAGSESADRGEAVSAEELLANRVIDTSGLDVEVGVAGLGEFDYPVSAPDDAAKSEGGAADKRGRRSRPRGQARQGRHHRSGR